MFRHVVLYRLKDPGEDSKQALKNRFLSLRDKIPEIVTLEAGTDQLFSGRSYDVALIITFRTQQDLFSYKSNPVHVSVSEYVHSVIKDSVSCDFEAEE